jgi:hypothetical protein
VLRRRFITRAPAALANVISPLSIAESPNPTCIIMGNRKGIAPIPVRNSIMAQNTTPKQGSVRSEKSSNGALWRHACRV